MMRRWRSPGGRSAEGSTSWVSLRTHGKALLVPAVFPVVVAAAAGFATSYPTVADHPVRLRDLPHAEQVHLQLSDLLDSHDGRGERRDDDRT
jgi:hypothetical protein